MILGERRMDLPEGRKRMLPSGRMWKMVSGEGHLDVVFINYEEAC
jgi:hypothetical protein